jgi:hypothetical protein
MFLSICTSLSVKAFGRPPTFPRRSGNKPTMYLALRLQRQDATKITHLGDAAPARTCYRAHKRFAVERGRKKVAP